MRKELEEAMESKDEARLRKTMNMLREKFDQLDIIFLNTAEKFLHKL